MKNWRKPENTICVDRTTKWGNPFKADWPAGGKDRAWAVSAFRGYYHDDAEYRAAVVRELRGKNLACFCSLDGPCHADVLMDWANACVSEAPGSASGLTVTIVEHPKGFLMRLEHDGACMTLDRAEAFDLHDKLSTKLGGMPVKL